MTKTMTKRNTPCTGKDVADALLKYLAKRIEVERKHGWNDEAAIRKAKASSGLARELEKVNPVALTRICNQALSLANHKRSKDERSTPEVIES